MLVEELKQLTVVPIRPRMVFAHMRSAKAYAETSYAKRLKVGCVIVDTVHDRPVSVGWNGTAPGEPNTCEKMFEGELVSLSGVIHAEANALARVPKETNPEDLMMFVTHSPCPSCTQEIIESGIKLVIYQQPYRITQGIVDMLEAGISVFRMVDLYAVVQHIMCQGQLVSVPVFVHPDV